MLTQALRMSKPIVRAADINIRKRYHAPTLCSANMYSYQNTLQANSHHVYRKK